MRRQLSRLPILWQSLLMMVVSVLVSAMVSAWLAWALPMPRMDFFTMSDVAQSLAAARRDIGAKPKDPALHLSLVATPPVPHDDLRSDPGLTRALADRIGVPVGDVRLVYRADQTNFPFRYRTNAGVPLRMGEAQFYNTAYAAVRRGDGRWIVAKTPDRPFITRYQRQSIMSFLLSILVTMPLAYVFARHLTAPIRRFADAAERVGADNAAPAVPVEGSTELRLAAEALAKMQQRVSETMAERTAMIVAIAHDLRTPLTRIAFRIEGAPDHVRQAVQADIDQMRQMVEASIGFIRHGTKIGDRMPLDLRVLAERIAADARAMGHDVTVAGGEAWIEGDGVALARMLQNIVDNAIDYAGAAEITIGASAGRATMTVADRGPGLDPRLLEDVFKPFTRGEPSRNRATGGLGLGLALARLVAEAHGGSLVAANRPDGGLMLVARFDAVARTRPAFRQVDAAAA